MKPQIKTSVFLILILSLSGCSYIFGSKLAEDMQHCLLIFFIATMISLLSIFILSVIINLIFHIDFDINNPRLSFIIGICASLFSLFYHSEPKFETPNSKVKYGITQLPIKWAYKTESFVFSHLTVKDKDIYFGTYNGFIHAVNINTGERKWTFNAKERAFIAINEGLGFVGSMGGKLYALNAESGQVKWIFNAAHRIIDSSCFDNNLLYFGNLKGIFYALDIKTGTAKWSFKTNHEIYSSPIIDNGLIYFSSSINVYALELDKGTQRWRSCIEGDVSDISKVLQRGIGLSSPVIKGRLLYTCLGCEKIYALNKETGRELWNFKVSCDLINSDRNILPSPVICGDIVLFSGGYFLYALDAYRGEVKWKFPTNGLGYISVFDDVIYFNQGQVLHAINMEGKEMWKVTQSGIIQRVGMGYTEQYDKTLYFSLCDGYLYAIDTKNLKRIHQ